MKELSIHTINNIQTMSSLDIAEVTGKEHYTILKDIRQMITECNLIQGENAFYLLDYTAENGKKNAYYELPKRASILLVSGYSMKFRMAIIDRWMQLEEILLDHKDLASEVEYLKIDTERRRWNLAEVLMVEGRSARQVCKYLRKLVKDILPGSELDYGVQQSILTELENASKSVNSMSRASKSLDNDLRVTTILVDRMKNIAIDKIKLIE